MQATTLLLLVEDDELSLWALEEALREGGFGLSLAKTGEEAIAALESHTEAIRGLITDVNLGPGSDGWAVARRGRELIPELPVVYMTGAAAQEWTAKGVPQSILLAKPFAPAQIITAIAGLINAKDGRQG